MFSQDKCNNTRTSPNDSLSQTQPREFKKKKKKKKGNLCDSCSNNPFKSQWRLS